MRLPIKTQRHLSKETLWALALALIILTLFIATADSAPLWIYQGF